MCIGGQLNEGVSQAASGALSGLADRQRGFRLRGCVAPRKPGQRDW